MGKLIYLLNISLDGFVETPDHRLDWATVDDELHTWFNDQMRTLDATLYGRRIYELMADHWPTAEADPSILTRVRRDLDGLFALNCDVLEPGRITVGDAVELH